MGGLDRRMGGYLRDTIFGWELWATLFAAALVSLLGDEQGLRTVSAPVGSAQVQIGTALLGIVLAALAILVVFLDDAYIALLESLPPGIEADLFPFQYTATVAALCAVTGVLLIMIGSPENAMVLRAVFFIATWSFLYLLAISLQLVSFVAGHARVRIKQKRAGRGKASADDP